MDDTTDKYCNYKTTDCTVTSTKDLYKALNFPKRFECPCKSFSLKASTYLMFSYFASFKRRLQRLRNSARTKELHLQDDELWLWVFHAHHLLGPGEVFQPNISYRLRLSDCLFLSGIIPWINSSAHNWRKPGCIATTRSTRASISHSVISFKREASPSGGCVNGMREDKRCCTDAIIKIL